MTTAEQYNVSSELYSENDYASTSKPMINRTNAVSKFKFQYPLSIISAAEADIDGDLVVVRKTNLDSIKEYGIVEIEHKESTGLELVGLQIWRGALLLADWLLHNSNIFQQDTIILELGSGVGFTSIIAAMFRPVFCTDIKKGGILKLIKGNVLRNKHLTKHKVNVLELDFTSQILPKEIVAAMSNISIILAADVVYDNIITEAFVKTIQHLLSKPPARSVYVALEKRFVFTIADCDSVAPCYEFFIDCLNNILVEDGKNDIVMEEVPLNFPQYFEYDRVKELILWKITSTFDDNTIK